MDEENIDLSDIGAALVAASEQGPTSPREVLRELFPYIEAASQRMSSRAISQWLKDNHHVQISPATIQRALREPDKHYRDFAEFIERKALIVEKATDIRMKDFLSDERIFEHLAKGEPPKSLCPLRDEDGFSEVDNFNAAVSFLEDKWFSLSAQTRDNCYRFFGADGEQEREGSTDTK
ncbi:MAG: hypothetical protein ACFUZC_23710 [Chthoniobacteraceae bacterium]